MGGYFTSAGGVAANRIAKWNGTSWSPLGSGIGVTQFSSVNALTGFGPALYTGGSFATAGGVASDLVAKWGCTN